MKTKNSSNRPSQSGATIEVKFRHDDKPYRAFFTVKKEKDSSNYKLNAEILNAKGKRVFEKERTGLDYIQVEPAMTFVFHQAFAQ